MNVIDLTCCRGTRVIDEEKFDGTIAQYLMTKFDDADLDYFINWYRVPEDRVSFDIDKCPDDLLILEGEEFYIVIGEGEKFDKVRDIMFNIDDRYDEMDDWAYEYSIGSFMHE